MESFCRSKEMKRRVEVCVDSVLREKRREVCVVAEKREEKATEEKRRLKVFVGAV